MAQDEHNSDAPSTPAVLDERSVRLRPLTRWQRVLLVSYVLYGLLGFVNAVFLVAVPMIWTVETSLFGRIVAIFAHVLMGLLVLLTTSSFKRCLQRCPRVTSNTDKWPTQKECAEIADPSDWGGKQPTAEQFNAGFMILPIVTAMIPLAVAFDVLMLIGTVFEAIEAGTIDYNQASIYVYFAFFVSGLSMQLGGNRRAMPRDKVDREPDEAALQLSLTIVACNLATWVCHDLNHTHQIAKSMAHQYKNCVGPWRAYLSLMPK